LLNNKHIKTLSIKDRINKGPVGKIIKLNKTKIVTSSELFYINLWDLKTYQCIHTIRLRDYIFFLSDFCLKEAYRRLYKLNDKLIAHVIDDFVIILKIEGNIISFVKNLKIEFLRGFVKINKTQTIYLSQNKEEIGLKKIEIGILDLENL